MTGYPVGRDSIYTNVVGLNTLHAEYEMNIPHSHQPHPHRPGYDFQSDLDMFTNTQFFDLDMGEVPETNSPISHDGEQWGAHSGSMGDRQVNTFGNFTTNSVGGAAYNGHSAISSSSATPMVERAVIADSDGKMSTTGIASTMEEASRMAAEEDKRRRNTAASARFRVKKKQREQALERTAKDMTDRVTFLENRVNTLEMENKLLKDLITEKSGAGAIVDLDELKRLTENRTRIEDLGTRRSKPENASDTQRT